jgi:eukaryotic-like serine/threonine-protein kinase
MTEPTPESQVSPDREPPPRPENETDSTALGERMLGEFRLLRRLGKGGMAEVYLAEQSSLKRQVAIKVLRADLLDDEKDHVLIKRFAQEATAAGGLSHANIVQVYQIGEANGIHYIVQEYVQGWTLKDYVKRKGPPDVSTAMVIMRQAASALKAAAEAGIVHRDIKPENIMLTRKGEVKVADFGLAQLARDTEGVDLTQVGMTMGTPLYMSPEQINGKKLDARSDLYSFGVTCYTMLAGRPPFDGNSPLSIAVQHLNEEPIPLSELRPDLPAPLVALIQRMMAKLPEKRIQSAGDVLRELKRIFKILKEDPESPELLLEDFSLSGPWDNSRLIPRDIVRRGVIFLLCLIPIAAISAGVGWLMRTPDPRLVQPEKDRIIVERKQTADAQFIQAAYSGSPEEWRAVIEYFPDDPEYTHKAYVQLVLSYLNSGSLVEAENAIKELKDRGFREDRKLLAAADAAEAILLHQQGNYRQSQSKLYTVETAALSADLLDLLKEVEERNTRILGETQR